MPPLRRLLPLLPVLAPAGCHRHADGRPWVEHAWVRLPAVAGRPAAAFLVLHGGAAAASLVAVDSQAAGSSELHRESRGPGAVMSMARVDAMPVPAGGTVRLAPGGYHAMLFGLSPAVRPGDRVPLTLRFARGTPLVATARAVAAGDPAPE